MIILKLFIFSLVMAYIMAKLEIEIEGQHGWAAKLPTWRIKNKFTKLFWGDQEYTGYHFWIFWMVMALLHFPFVLGLSWTPRLELQILGVFFIGVIFEDFFWFILNPHYGLKKFTKEHAHWHHEWYKGVPALYIRLAALTAFCAIIGFFFTS
jgi:hypothetical protein